MESESFYIHGEWVHASTFGDSWTSNFFYLFIFIYLRQFDVVNFPSFTLFLKAKLSGFVYFSLLRH